MQPQECSRDCVKQLLPLSAGLTTLKKNEFHAGEGEGPCWSCEATGKVGSSGDERDLSIFSAPRYSMGHFCLSPHLTPDLKLSLHLVSYAYWCSWLLGLPHPPTHTTHTLRPSESHLITAPHFSSHSFTIDRCRRGHLTGSKFPSYLNENLSARTNICCTLTLFYSFPLFLRQRGMDGEKVEARAFPKINFHLFMFTTNTSVRYRKSWHRF